VGSRRRGRDDQVAVGVTTSQSAERGPRDTGGNRIAIVTDREQRRSASRSGDLDLCDSREVGVGLDKTWHEGRAHAFRPDWLSTRNAPRELHRLLKVATECSGEAVAIPELPERREDLRLKRGVPA